MRGLLLTQDFLPDLPGGIAIYYHHLCRELGGDVSVLAPGLSDAGEFDRAQPFRVHRSRMPVVPPAHMRETRFPFLRWPRVAYIALAQWRRFLKDASRIAAEDDIDIMLLGHLYLGPLGPRLRARTGARYTVFLHSGELHRYMRFPPVRRSMIGALDAADFLIVNSEFTRRQYLERGVRRDQRFVKVNPGVDTSRFRPDAGDPEAVRARFDIGDRPLLLSVARLVEWKGHDTVLRALPAVLERVPDAVYLVAGDGPFRPDLQRMVERLRLEDRVIFAGYVPDDDLPSFYRAADVMVVPSREVTPDVPIEGFGIVYVEASACGTPVVGGRGGGTDESIDDEVTGFRVDADDPDAVAHAVARLLTDPELARRFGQAGRRHAVERYDWSIQARRLRTFVEAIDSGNGAAGGER